MKVLDTKITKVIEFESIEQRDLFFAGSLIFLDKTFWRIKSISQFYEGSVLATVDLSLIEQVPPLTINETRRAMGIKEVNWGDLMLT